MKDSKKYLLVFGLFLVLVCGSLSFLFLPVDKKDIAGEFAVTIVGNNNYGSVLEVKFENTDLSIEDFDCHWWYSSSADSTDKIYIDGAESYKYKVDEGLVGKYIGVTLTHKESLGSVMYADVTDADNNKTKTVSAKDTQIDFVKTEFIYNGLNIENDYAKSNVDAEINYTYYTDKKCKKATNDLVGALYDGGAPVDAGTYYVRTSIMDSPDYKSSSSDCVKIVIKPVDVAVSWSVGDFVYNGTYQGPVASINNTVTPEVVNLSSTNVVNAGNYVSEARCVEVIGGRGKCSNFNIVKNVIDFRIDVSSSIIGLTPVVSVYTGEPVFANKAVTNIDREVKYTYYKDSLCTKKVDVNDGVSVKGNAPIDAGRYYVQASVESDGNNSAALSSCVEHIIEPKKINVIWDKTKFVYDGTNKVPTTSLVSGISDEAIIASTNTSVLPGSYLSTASCNKVIGGRGKCSNYLLVNEVGSFEIDRATAYVNLKSKEIIYNGSVSYANDVVTNSDGKVNYVYYTDKNCSTLTSINDGALYDGAAPVDAGNYYVIAYVEASNLYNATLSGCVSHVIKPINVDVDVLNKTLEYDGNFQKNDYTFNYSKLEEEKVNLDINGYLIPGKYKSNVFCSSVLGGRGKCSNYLINSNTADLIVKKATSNVEISNYEKVYDANFNNPVYVTNSDGEVVFNYYSDSSCKNMVDYPIDAGKYFVQAMSLDTPFYNQGLSKCVSYEIKPLDVDVMWFNNEFVYNGELQGPGASAYGVNGSTIEFDTLKSIQTGKYNSSIKCISVSDGRNNCSNYKFNNVNYEYSILKADSDIVFDMLDVVTTYPNKVVVNYTKVSDGEVECYSSDDSIAKCVVNSNNIEVIPVNMGSTTFNIKLSNSDNYNSIEKVLNINVELPKYAITLNYNDGTGMIDRHEKLYNVDFVLPRPVSSKIGYKFIGWSVLEDGSTIDYNAGDKFSKNISKELYGVWENTIYINETFDDSEISKYFESISGEYVIDGNMKIFNSTSKLIFTPNKNSILSFDIGKVNVDGTLSNNFIVEILGSDDSKYEIYSNSDLNYDEFRLENYKLKKDVTYTLKFTYLSDNENNYGYIDNLLVEIDDSIINYKKDEFSFLNLFNDISNMFDKLFKAIKNMFK